MKVAIDTIQKSEVLSQVNTLIGSKINGGGSLQGSTSTLTNFNNTNVAIGNAKIFALTFNNAVGNVSSGSISGRENGTGFSISASSSAAVTG